MASDTDNRPADQSIPAQHQEHQPGRETEMRPRPEFEPMFPGVGRLHDQVALITGGDSGIGRAVAVAMAREGARITVLYLDEQRDAEETCRLIEEEGSEAFALAGDIGEEEFCRHAVEETVRRFGRLDILVNNAGEQHPDKDVTAISRKQLKRTFQTNVFGMFYMVQAAMPFLGKGAAIINCTSVTMYEGASELLDYSATKRVNGVAPGPIWTPLIPASFDEQKTAQHGASAPMQRPGQPDEVAPSYIFLAAESDSSYINGQVLHPNGGTVVNG